MNKAKISVCMATYNGAKYIKEQLQSILLQLKESDEVIISDDGSTDETLPLIESFADKRIKIYHHKKRNTKFHLDNSTHNFENALKLCTGDIIFLSDQDDVWLPKKVELMVKGLKDAMLVVSDCKLVDNELKIIHPSYFEQNGVHEGIINNFIRYTLVGCCMAFRRELLNKALPFPPTKVGHDLWLAFMAYHYYNVGLIREPLMLFRRHGNNVTPCGSKSSYSLVFKINYRCVIMWAFLKRVCFGK